MKMRVEYFAFRLDGRQAGPAQDVEQAAVNQFHSLVELFRDGRVAVLERPLKAVQDGQERPDQIRRGVLKEFLFFMLNAFAVVLELGLLPQQAVVQLAFFRQQVLVSSGKVKRQLLDRSEEHTSELQSRLHLVCRLLLEKKKKRSVYRHLEYSYVY